MNLYQSIQKLASKIRSDAYTIDDFGDFQNTAKAKFYFIDMLRKLSKDTFQKWGVVRVEHQSGSIGFIGKDTYRIEFQDKIINNATLFEFVLEDVDSNTDKAMPYGSRPWERGFLFSLKSLGSRSPEVTGECEPTKQSILRSIHKVILPQLDKLFLKGRAKYMRENPDEFSNMRGELRFTDSGGSGELTLLC